MFTQDYINKCIEFCDEISHLILQVRNPMKWGQIVMTTYIFQPDDAFHCLKKMAPSEHKTVKEVIRDSVLIADDPSEEFPIVDCVILPTEQQLKSGVEAVIGNLRTDAYGQGPERLLDAIIEYYKKNNIKEII